VAVTILVAGRGVVAKQQQQQQQAAPSPIKLVK